MSTTAPPADAPTQPVFISTWDFDERLREAFGFDFEGLSAPISVQATRWWCEAKCHDLGIPFQTIEVPRWNDKSQRIGNHSEIDLSAGDIVLAVVEAMVKARDEAFDLAIARVSAPSETL